MEERMDKGLKKRKKVNFGIKRDFQIWLLVRIIGTILLVIFIASILSYLYSKGAVDADQLSFKSDIRKTSEVMLPILLAASLASLIAGLLLALYLPKKIAGPIYRIEQDLLVIGEGDLAKTINLRNDDILKDLAESVNSAVNDINLLVKNIKESGREIENTITEGELDEIKKAFEMHKKQLERIKT